MSSIELVKADITTLDCDCIVNSAKKSLGDGQGVCGAIYKAAGRFRLKVACMRLHGCNTGKAKITPGFKLKAKYIIHTVGPRAYDGPTDELLLSACYCNSLDVAKENGIHVIAFPAISTGSHHYPIKESCSIAVNAVRLWINSNSDYDMKIIFCMFDDINYKEYEKQLK